MTEDQMLVALSKRQREQLLTLASAQDDGEQGFWRPHGAAVRTANALVERGLLRRDAGYGGRMLYSLTDSGYAAARSLS